MFTRARTFVIAVFALGLMLLGIAASRVGALGNSITAVDFGGHFDMIATSSGDIYLADHPSAPDGSDVTWTRIGNTGSASPIVQIQYTGGDGQHEYVWAYSEDGTLYVSTDFGHSWAPRGNVFTGTTPTRRESWGHLKLRYR